MNARIKTADQATGIWHLRLSWPPRALWQNHRRHWRDRHRATKAYRTEAWGAALEAAVPKIPDATIEFTFHPPDNIRRDIQNMPATMKAAIDGIADAMRCDDKGFRPVFPSSFGPVTKGGCVCIRIKEV